MPRNRKPELYGMVKDAGLPLTTTYAQYKLDELKAQLTEAGIEIPDPPPEPPKQPRSRNVPKSPVPEDTVQYEMPSVPVSNTADPEEMPGQRLNTQPEEVPIRIDELGRMWFQEEVRKPAYPKPRGRRVLKYLERGVEKKTVQNGEYIETFEVAGQGVGRPAEVKITLPSYQVGIYKDPRFPFRIHCYNGREGFDLFEVHRYYGGSQLVPESCKRIYVENDLCYDIKSVVRTIQAEHRQLQLTGRIK